MNKKQRIAKIVELITCLNTLHVGIGSGLRFDYRLDRDSLFVNGLSDDLAHLYLLLHNGSADSCVYLQYGDNGMELEIMVLK